MSVFREGVRGGASRALVAAVTLAGLTALAFAQADGPDYFRISGLKKEDRVNIRRTPDLDARIVGKIPKDADGIRNLGCKGGLTRKQWEKASEARKKSAARERWCQVEHDGMKGWVLGRFLAEGSAPEPEPKLQQQAAQPAPPVAPPAQNVFSEFRLRESGKELGEARLRGQRACSDRPRGRAALCAGKRSIERNSRLRAASDSQSKWRGQLVTCFDRECVSEVMVRRVHQLRRDHKEARAQDGKGISMGPLVARCDGFPIPVAVTYVNSDPGFAYLEWMDGFVVMPHTPSGSGARYEGSFARFHTQGDSGLLLIPGGKAEMNCKLERSG
jgi:hypothetical protein